MTPAEWDRCDDPAAMLAVLGEEEPVAIPGAWGTMRGTATMRRPRFPVSERKLRLWVEACRERSGIPPALEWMNSLLWGDAVSAWAGRQDDVSLSRPERAALLRCVVGSPFRPACPPVSSCPECGAVTFAYWHVPVSGHARVKCRCGFAGVPSMPDRSWLTPTAVGLATAIDAESRWADLPVLADALEEAGCTDAAVLAHLRGPGPHHCAGCHVLDLILGRE